MSSFRKILIQSQTNNYKLRGLFWCYIQVDIVLNLVSVLSIAIPLLYLANKFAREYTESQFIKALEYNGLLFIGPTKTKEFHCVCSNRLRVVRQFVGSLLFEQIGRRAQKYYETFSSSLLVYSRLKNIRWPVAQNAAITFVAQWSTFQCCFSPVGPIIDLLLKTDQGQEQLLSMV